jgi:hypothetical protein
MTAVARHAAPLPDPSPWLRDALAHVASPHPDVGLEPARIRPGVREEAQRRADAMAPQLAAASADWERFLLPLRALPSAPTSDRGFATAVGAIAFALADIPASVLTVQHQREALRTLRFWPSPHDLDQVLRASANTLRAEHRRLLAIATAPAVPQAAAPTPIERAEIAGRAASLAAEIRSRGGDPTAEPRRAVPRTLSPAALIAGYEAAGTPAALYRAEQLRRQMEG